MSAVDPIVAKLERLEAKPSLVLDAVDYDLRDRDAVRERLAAPLTYSQRVEALVTGLSIETLLPRVSGDDGSPGTTSAIVSTAVRRASA